MCSSSDEIKKLDDRYKEIEKIEEETWKNMNSLKTIITDKVYRLVNKDNK